jgi:drug/metabolite transporter (DMT)-like permease
MQGCPPMPPLRLFTLIALALIAFAANAVLCRLAFTRTEIDPASFTAIRLGAGALALWLIVRRRAVSVRTGGNWPSALALFAFAVGHTFGYVSVPAGAGTLLFCGTVQASMIFPALWAGERLGMRPSAGLALALGGLIILVLPGLSAPPLGGSALMLGAGVAWGVYSLLGRGTADPAAATAGNFLRATWLALALVLGSLPWARLDGAGVAYAALTGMVFTGLGYAIWYAALPGLSATRAATVQLSVPVIAALGGVTLVGEPITLRLVLASSAVLGGCALVVLSRPRRR